MNMEKELVKLAFRLGFETAQQAKAQPQAEQTQQPAQEKTAGQKLIEQYGAKIQAQKQAAEAELKKQAVAQLLVDRIQANRAKKAQSAASQKA